MAGALVLRGPMGFGAGSQIHTAKILQLSMDLPVVIEIIDTKEKVDAFLPTVSSMVNGGLVTVQPVTIVHAAVAEKKRQG